MKRYRDNCRKTTTVPVRQFQAIIGPIQLVESATSIRESNTTVEHIADGRVQAWPVVTHPDDQHICLATYLNPYLSVRTALRYSVSQGVFDQSVQREVGQH